MSVDGERLYFPKDLLSLTLRIAFRNRQGVRHFDRVTLLDCIQRVSLVAGQLDSGDDVWATTIKGRIVGCKLSGDWWIRAVPMFGPQQSLSHEGVIRPTDGVFHITGSLVGVRHLLIVGKNGRPAKSFATNVTVGAANDVGPLDISGSCVD